MSAPFFASVGMGNVVCANRVLCIITPRSVTAKTLVKNAKAAGTIIDCTMAKTIKSVILLDNGSVMLSHITPATLRYRLGNLAKPKPWKGTEELAEGLMEEDSVSVLLDEEDTTYDKEDEQYGDPGTPLDEMLGDGEEEDE